MTEVVTALIQKESKVLICQRPPHKGNALKWEFVGGKVEKGETKEEALIRECREELDVKIKVGKEITSITHVYPDITAHITLFYAEIVSGTPKMLEHVNMTWINPKGIDSFDFCTADNVFIEKVKSL